jgi:signal transduction histidine kinase
LEQNKAQLQEILMRMDIAREELYTEFGRYYDPYLHALQRLSEGIDLHTTINWNSEQRAELERRVEQLNALAQSGITVEIVGHELETLDAEISRNLKRLPRDVRQLDAYKLASSAHQALVTRLHFLTPLRIAGAQFKERITGQQLYEYLRDFFARQINESHINLEFSDSFMALSITDYPYRIFPVFVNLINNAIYWLRFVESRFIRIDLLNGEVIIADSGRGVDPDDIEHLFELFFTRRVSGRGVGLYLCLTNLAASGHSIRYQHGGPLLSGANFIITFKGLGNA